MAPTGELYSTCAVETPFTIGSAFEFHAMMWPDSEEKMNAAGPLPALDLTSKLLVGLNTCPVGAGSAGGRVTVRLAFVAVAPPAPTPYTVATLVPLSATHSGLVGLSASPQEFCRSASTTLSPTLP